MEDVLKVFEEESSLDSLDQIKEDYIVISIIEPDDPSDNKVGSFRLYKGSKTFRNIDKAISEWYESKDLEPTYEQRNEKIVEVLDKMMKDGRFYLLLNKNSNEKVEEITKNYLS